MMRKALPMESQIEFQIFASLENVITFWPTVLVYIIAGVYTLGKGADWLVDGAANIGFRLGISATMIGLTIVAFGTSAPELVVSIMTAIQGRPEICLGNVIGSNIANTTLILGATALVFPLNIGRDTLRFDGPISFLAIFMIFILALLGGNVLSRLDGIIMLVVFFTWLIWLVRKSLREAKEKKAAQTANADEDVIFQSRSPMIDLFFVGLGLVGLVVGAKLLVAGAVKTAQVMGVPDIVVGLTVVAGGTSLPELAVCLAAAFKKQGDITVGNVLGSNIFNAWLIMGTALVITPIVFNIDGFALMGDAGTLFIDIPFCVFICAILIPVMRSGKQLSRANGALLVAAYVGYIAFLVYRNLGL